MLDSSFKRNEHKKEKIITIIVLIISIIMIVVFSYLLYLNIKSRPLVDYPNYVLSSNDWTSGNVIITVSNDNNKIGSYSFDGGKTYQEFNTYEVSENSEIYLIVKDINGRSSNMVPISINRIDKEPPIINFEANTTIQVGSIFSLKNGVTVFDEGSGLSNNYVVTPDVIDTNIPGEYVVKYTAFDKVGNYVEKTRNIVVTDVVGTTYYRYRDGKIVYNKCEPYLCNCVVSDAAKLNGSCPSGYTFDDNDKCCQTCYKTCKDVEWGEWSEWTTKKVTPNAIREVETKIE